MCSPFFSWQFPSPHTTSARLRPRPNVRRAGECRCKLRRAPGFTSNTLTLNPGLFFQNGSCPRSLVKFSHQYSFLYANVV